MASSTRAQSSALRQMGPSLSIVHESAMAPVRGTRPKVGRRPVTPLTVEGEEMEPSVSLPMAKPTSPAAVAEAAPAGVAPGAPEAAAVAAPGGAGGAGV